MNFNQSIFPFTQINDNAYVFKPLEPLSIKYAVYSSVRIIMNKVSDIQTINIVLGDEVNNEKNYLEYKCKLDEDNIFYLHSGMCYVFG